MPGASSRHRGSGDVGGGTLGDRGRGTAAPKTTGPESSRRATFNVNIQNMCANMIVFVIIIIIYPNIIAFSGLGYVTLTAFDIIFLQVSFTYLSDQIVSFQNGFVLKLFAGL